MSDIVYDLEVYPNFTCGYFGNPETRQCWAFEISGVRQIYNRSKKLIEAGEEERFKLMTPEHKMLIPQIDLYKVHHFDNKARATSLKALEFNMRSENIEDLPFEPGTKLTDKQKDKVLAYNKHDMAETVKFYRESLDQIRFREELCHKYQSNFLNYNDTKIGKAYFVMRLEEANPGCCYKERKIQQTKRDKIDLNDCILPYIQFERPEFQAVKEWLSNQTITKTKGVFTDILEKDLGDLANHANMRTKQKKYPSSEEAQEACFEGSWVEDRELKSGKISNYLCWRVADNLNTIVDDFQFDFGTGGIHGSIENTIVDTDNEGVVVDKDVKSMYPAIAIANSVYPAHLGETFCEIYTDVYNQRQQYAKGTPENAMMKLALNGVYGDSNNQYSPFYDPQYTMTITVSGQLSLCMLAEKLMEVPTLQMIQVNTDGVTYKVSSDHKEKADEKCERWMKETGLELEEGIYKRMALRDVNNYLALDLEGKVKQKGAYQSKDMGWHQNQSALVIPKAAEHALLYDGDIEEFIHNHKDIYDFMLRVKTPKTSRLVDVNEDGEDQPLQNITRYYVSNDGVELVKIMPPLEGQENERRIGVQSGWKVTPCNNIKNYKGDINYEYYVKEARKLVDPLLTRQ